MGELVDSPCMSASGRRRCAGAATNRQKIEFVDLSTSILDTRLRCDISETEPFLNDLYRLGIPNEHCKLLILLV